MSFYLDRSDVHSYGTDERDRLIADLLSRAETPVLVKSGRTVEELVQALPDSLEFVPWNPSGLITAGMVRDG